MPNPHALLHAALSFCALSLTALSSPAHGNLTNTISIQLTQPPGTNTNDPMYAKITGADDNDPTPNPCYAYSSCYLGAWAVEATWPNMYMSGYSTVDTTNLRDRQKCGSAGKTVGAVVKCLRAANLLYMTMDDYLPRYRGDEPAMCLFLNQGTAMGLGANQGPVGPCARAYRPSSCTYDGTLNIAVRGGPSLINGRPTGAATGGGSITCSAETSGLLRVTTIDGSVVLDNGGVCAVDFGAGPGKPYKISIRPNTPYRVNASCTFSGVTTPGVHTGSAVVLYAIE